MRRSAAKRPEEIVIHLEIVLPLPNAVAFGTREKEFLQLVARFVSRFIVGKSRLVVAPPFVGERKLDSGEHLPALFVEADLATRGAEGPPSATQARPPVAE